MTSLDPLGREFALLVGTIHGEHRDYAAFLQPPYAEAVTLEIAAMHHLVGVGCVTPLLIGQIEHIGEEVRHVAENSALAQQCARAMLSLRNGVVPVLHAASLFEDHVLIIR